MKRNNPVLIFFAVGLVLLFAAGSVTAADSTQRMSVNNDGDAGNHLSRNSERLNSETFENTARTLTGTGNMAAFQSLADNFSEWDTNGNWDIYVRDAVNGTTTLVSKGLDGYAADGDSHNPAISSDGRYVAFDSEASDLVAGEYDEYRHVYRRDLQTNTTVRVSVGPDGYGGDDDSENPSISQDGRYVAFQSYAENLDPDFEQVMTQHIYRADMSTTPPTIKVVSVGPDGETGGDGNSYNPSISHSGQFVAFSSFAENLSQQDTNGYRDVFIRNMSTGVTQLVSVGLTRAGYAGNDRSGNPSTSGNGRYVAFESEADDLVANPETTSHWYGYNRQIYVRDTVNGVTYLVSVDPYGYGGDDDSDNPSISSDGRYVAFESLAENLVENDTNGTKDIFVYDRLNGTMTQVNVNSIPNPPDTEGDSWWRSNRPSISPDGRYVSFDSKYNFVGDTLEVGDWVRQVYRNDYFDQNGDGVRDGEEVPGVVNTPTNVTVAHYSGTGTVNVTTSTPGATITFAQSQDPSLAFRDKRGEAPGSIACGLVNFSLNVATPGSTAQVTITFPCSIEGKQYYKYTTTGWFIFSNEALYPGAVSISGNTVTLTLTDGGAGDLDGVANGVIVDPSGAGSPPAVASGGDSGGCFIGTLAN